MTDQEWIKGFNEAVVEAFYAPMTQCVPGYWQMLTILSKHLPIVATIEDGILSVDADRWVSK